MLADGDRVLVAVSGGADSVALLHLLRQLAGEWRLLLAVLHVDHRLRRGSARDAEFVRALGRRLGVPVDIATVDVSPGASEEAAARAARYAALDAHADRIGAQRIAIGHTADDQAETVLMRVLEGSGLRGLAGIPPTRGRIIRPLIATRRTELVAELGRAGLEWVDDPSNLDPKFFRNRVRHDLLPLLADSCAPGIVPRLAKVAGLLREAVDAIERVARLELDRSAVITEGALVLPRAGLAVLPGTVAAEVLRQASARVGGRPSLRAWAHRGLRRILRDPPPRRPFRLGGVAVEVSVGLVRVSRPALPTVLPPRPVPVPGRVELPEIGMVLEARIREGAGYQVPRERGRVAFDLDALAAPLVVRGRLAGDRFRPFAGPGERRLKTVLIDDRVPRWERNRLAIVEAGGDILWVGGVRRASAAPVTGLTRRVLELALKALAQAHPGQ